MLNVWTVENFKSLAGTTALSLGRVTALCGANSSGKSSIIHSILMMKQSVNADQPGKQIALNGHWIKLGTFSDVLSFGDFESLSIQYSFDVQEQVRPMSYGYDATSHSDLRRSSGNIKNISGSFRWEAAEKYIISDESSTGSPDFLTSLSPVLVEATTTIGLRDGPHESGKSDDLYISVKPKYFLAEEDLDFAMRPIARLSSSFTRDIESGLPEAQISDCVMSNFLPDELVVFYNKARSEARKAAAYFVPESVRTTPASPPAPLSPEVFTKLNSWLVDHGIAPIALRHANSESFTRIEMRRRMSRTRYESRIPSTAKSVIDFSDLRNKVENWIFGDENNVARDVQFKTPMPIREANAYVREFFLTGVRYLGPLREEPRAVYPAEALARPDDVGTRGEHTAAVIDLNRNKQVWHIPPPDGVGAPERVPLSQALEQWLQYLGVATSVEIKDAGKFGRQFKVRSEEGGSLHDLTHVGVGVSQVLPILVMALLAKNPCLLLLEQPELHLHPKVQARLADFFIAMGRLGKQCIIETHSEYLIDRLRLRIAESKSDDVLEMVKLYFTEKVSGSTSCREVNISSFGSIIDWPSDFFDQSADESTRILRAAASKRTSIMGQQLA